MFSFKNLAIYITLSLSPLILLAQKVTEGKSINTSYQSGEQVTYLISYTWFCLWTDVGEVTFKVTNETKDGKYVLHLKCTGSTYPFYDWFFKVRDLYESWIDPSTQQPVHFNRAINEGGFTKENEYQFDWSKDQVFVRVRRKSNPSKYNTLKIEKNTYDVISAIYAARNFNYSNIKPDKIFPITAIFDKEIYKVGYKFLGREEKQIKGIGKLNCLKFQVDLVVGDIFANNQKLYVWVTDDQNHIPAIIESPIKIGSIKARVTSWTGLRNKASFN